MVKKPVFTPEGDKVLRMSFPDRANELFIQACELEDSSAAEAERSYREAIALDPCHALACVNLGILLYTRRVFDEAEFWYRTAIGIDASIPVAYFALANVCDETKRNSEAEFLYRKALELSPKYADAHYNLALLLEKTCRFPNALPHWQAYIQSTSETNGPYIDHAKNRIAIILGNAGLRMENSPIKTGEDQKKACSD